MDQDIAQSNDESLKMLPIFRVAIVLLLSACSVPSAWATTIDQSPRPARILAGGKQFLAQDRMHSVSLYAADGKQLHAFKTNGRLKAFDVTTDESQLILADWEGGLGMWSLDSGKRLWRLSASKSGLDSIYDVSLSHDGQRIVVSNAENFALVLDSQTGSRIARIDLPMQNDGVESAALSPDGKTGILLASRDKLYSFDVTNGAVRDTGLTGSRPIRIAADGRHAVCRSNNSGTNEQLRVIEIATWKAIDIGPFKRIGCIRPQPNGGFHVTASEKDQEFGDVYLVGVFYSPDTMEPVERWKCKSSIAGSILTDFGGDPTLGVSTNHRLITQLVNLRDAKTILSIDNSAHYEVTYISWSSNGIGWNVMITISGFSAAVVIVLIIILRRCK